MLASSLHSTIESELLSKVCFSRSSKESASFGVVAPKAMRANGIEELEQEVALQEKGD
jgi:hypothetical protein